MIFRSHWHPLGEAWQVLTAPISQQLLLMGCGSHIIDVLLVHAYCTHNRLLMILWANWFLNKCIKIAVALMIPFKFNSFTELNSSFVFLPHFSVSYRTNFRKLFSKLLTRSDNSSWLVQWLAETNASGSSTVCPQNPCPLKTSECDLMWK